MEQVGFSYPVQAGVAHPKKTHTSTQTTNKVRSHNQRRWCLKIPLLLPKGGLQTDWPSSRERTDPEWLAMSQSGSVPTNKGAQMEWSEFPACASRSDSPPGDTECGLKLRRFPGSWLQTASGHGAAGVSQEASLPAPQSEVTSSSY